MSSRSKSPQVVVDVEKLSKMTAHDRVIAGYKLAAQRRAQRCRPSASFKSGSVRDPYHIHGGPVEKTEQQKRKEAAQQQAEEEKRAKFSKGKKEPSNLHEYIEAARKSVTEKPEQFKRCPSAWTRDTTPRGGYMFNWKSFPEAVPRKKIADTPGPGAYTDPLHFVGS